MYSSELYMDWTGMGRKKWTHVRIRHSWQLPFSTAANTV